MNWTHGRLSHLIPVVDHRDRYKELTARSLRVFYAPVTLPKRTLSNASVSCPPYLLPRLPGTLQPAM